MTRPKDAPLRATRKTSYAVGDDSHAVTIYTRVHPLPLDCTSHD